MHGQCDNEATGGARFAIKAYDIQFRRPEVDSYHMMKSGVFFLGSLLAVFLLFAFFYEEDTRLDGKYFKTYIGDDIEIYKKGGSFGIAPRIFLIEKSGDKLFVIQRSPEIVGNGDSAMVHFGPCAFFVVDTDKEEERTFNQLSDLATHADPITYEKLLVAAEEHCVDLLRHD